MPLIILATVIGLGYFLLRNKSSTTDTQTNTTASIGVGSTNLPTPTSLTSKPKPIVHRVKYVTHDYGTIAQNPMFSTPEERAYILRHSPRGQIPHSIQQEGQTRQVGRHTQKMVKWLTRSGSDTRWTNVN